nr:hypothetical protein CFP56_36195 [Quercus suber]
MMQVNILTFQHVLFAYLTFTSLHIDIIHNLRVLEYAMVPVIFSFMSSTPLSHLVSSMLVLLAFFSIVHQSIVLSCSVSGIRYLANEQFADAVVFFDGIEQKEARSGKIVLVGDNSEAIHDLIGHLYGREVVITGISCSEGGLHLVQNQVETYVAATKYMVPTLCTRIEEIFPDNLACLLDSSGPELKITYISQIARLVYIKHDIAAQKLQGPVVTLLARHAAELTQNTEFRALNVEIPELAFQLLMALAAPKKAACTKVKKRKS